MKFLFLFFNLIAAGVLHAQDQDTSTVIPLQTGKMFRFKGLAIDEMTSTAYLGSWDQKQIVAVSLKDKIHRVISTPYSGKLNGMGCYIRDRSLYVVMNEVDDDPQHKPISVLLAYDLDKNVITRTYELKGVGGRNHFNHVVVDKNGVAYISNTLKGNVLMVDTRDPKSSFKTLIQHDDLAWIHGVDLSPDGNKLFMTSYESGIRIFDLKSGKFSPYKQKSTAGDDGLKYYKGSLYGVGQNTLKKYQLDKTETSVIEIDTLINNHRFFNDARCIHIWDRTLYSLGNIELEPVTFRNAQIKPKTKAFEDTYLIKFGLSD